MKVVVVTSMGDAPEITRIREEFEALGHEFVVYNMKDFKFEVIDNKLAIPGLTDIGAELVLVRGVLSNLKPIASLVKRLRDQGIKVFDNNFLVHKYSISKVTDLVKLAMAEVPIPDTLYVKTWEEFPAACERVGYPAIIKSVRAGQGVGVFKMDDAKELEEFMQKMQSEYKKPTNYLIQSFFDYELDLRVLIIGDAMFAMQRIPREGDFRANFSLGGTVKKHELTDSQRELAQKAIKAVDMSIAGVDVLVGKDGSQLILEVNHTAGMKGMESATNENIVKVYVEHVLAAAK